MPIVYTGPAPFRCTKDYPIKVEFHNSSQKTVGYVSFDVEAHARDHTSNLAQNSYSMHFDGVMKPGFGWTQCYNVAVQPGYDPVNLEYRGSVDYAVEAAK